MSLGMLIQGTIFVIIFIITLILLISVLKGNKQNKKQSSLIKCPDCQHTVSINARMCPNCGNTTINNQEFKNNLLNMDNNKRYFNKTKISLIVHQLINGIIIVFVYEWSNKFITQLLLLSSLLINTISLIIFTVKYKEIRKELNINISIISILAIICGTTFSVMYTQTLLRNISYGYREDVREIMYSGTYTKKEAEELIDNLYSALKYHDYDLICTELYSFFEDRELPNVYTVNIRESCKSEYLPPNAMKIVINEYDKTKIDKIYWHFNDEIQIVFYENGQQAKELEYVYLSSLYKDEPRYEIKQQLEAQVRSKLKSPSSAVFTYNSFRYFQSSNRFKYYGWVEGENSFGAMVREDFVLTLIPCKISYCEYYGLDYKWEFTS